MLVELDIFSGRPNPRWRLDEPDARALLRLQAGLAEADAAPAEPPALGYRGFLYADASGRCRACLGYVRTPAATLADPAFSIERFLLDRLPPDLAALRGKIAPSLESGGPAAP